MEQVNYPSPSLTASQITSFSTSFYLLPHLAGLAFSVLPPSPADMPYARPLYLVIDMLS